MRKMKDEWFDFFRSISNGNSEVGNYKVSAGVFKGYKYLEKYTFTGLKTLKQSLLVGI